MKYATNLRKSDKFFQPKLDDQKATQIGGLELTLEENEATTKMLRVR